MSDLAELLKEHYDNHPAMEVRDAIKFIYQSHMGPGHLISDERAALDRLAEEWARLPADKAIHQNIESPFCPHRPKDSP